MDGREWRGNANGTVEWLRKCLSTMTAGERRVAERVYSFAPLRR